MRLPATILSTLVLLACSGTGSEKDHHELPVDAGLDIKGNPLDGIEVSVAFAIPFDFSAISVRPMDELRTAIVRVSKRGDALCPDCVELGSGECPQACIRFVVDAEFRTDATGGERVEIASYYPPSFDHSIGQVEAVALPDGRLGVAWLECDNLQCESTTGARRSCDAKYIVFDSAAGTSSDVRELYADRFGDIQLAASNSNLLVMVGKDLHGFAAGVSVGIFSLTGDAIEELAPLSGRNGALAKAVSTGDGFAVVVEDPNPEATRPEPCMQSCDCVEIGAAKSEDGGLMAFLWDGAQWSNEKIFDPEDRRWNEKLALGSVDGKLVVAATQSIDGSAFLHRRDDDGRWDLIYEGDSPIPTWLGVLGVNGTLAFLGSQPDPNGQSLLAPIVAGVSSGDIQVQGSISEPFDGSVFWAGPPRKRMDASAESMILRGILDEDGALGWARFEVVRIRGMW